ncbi:AlpA family transcriptional regulator [Vibrio parahaemolyticus]|uniref:helix-turn-helix transcriptional regulator n=1 Tax=Vibrio parahaemolyticus TaxID=670 RepID=UPI0015930A02|nr:AlpA family transcriptional regulator [Vibrio parahaemolyticus]EKA7363824.1 AlpA family transcriptional regulator [Vibrio parahaemolyticus]NVC26287.1 AlpA family transcriptional regulator [Vibrio parahaemolyticus]
MQNEQIRLITLREVIALTSLSRASIYNYISKNMFPRQISVGERSVRWIESEVQEWIRQKIECR